MKEKAKVFFTILTILFLIFLIKNNCYALKDGGGGATGASSLSTDINKIGKRRKYRGIRYR